MRKRFAEEQIFEFLREARQWRALGGELLPMAQQVRRDERIKCDAAESTGKRDYAVQGWGPTYRGSI